MDALLQFLRQLINGLQSGSIYALVALGYTMVYGIVKLINFAHGDIIMIGAYCALFFITLLSGAGLPVWLCVIPAMVFCALLGMLCERVAYRPLRHSPRISSLITAIGISLLLQNGAQLIFSPNPQSVPKIFSAEALTFGSFSISLGAIITIVVSIAIMAGLQTFVKGTRMGKAMRAVSEDDGASKLVGINVNSTIQLTFAIGSALAAIGSVLYISAYPQVQPTMGSLLGLKAFVAAVLGGIGIIPGAMIGGLIMGIFESLTKAYISSQLSDAVVFGILIIVLLVKPSGILGKNTKEKV